MLKAKHCVNNIPRENNEILSLYNTDNYTKFDAFTGRIGVSLSPSLSLLND
jgi:hypothetical protein